MKRFKKIIEYTIIVVNICIFWLIVDAFFDVDMDTRVWITTSVFLLQSKVFSDRRIKDLESGYCKEKLNESK